MGFSGVNNFPTHTIVDGHFRGVLEETGMSVKKEFEMVALARRMDLFSIVYVATPEEAIEMAKAGADAIIAHVGTTVGGSIGVKERRRALGLHREAHAGNHRCREPRAEGHLFPLPRRTDQHTGRRGSRFKGHRCGRFCRRKLAGAYGRRSFVDGSDARVQEFESARRKIPRQGQKEMKTGL